MRFRCGFVIQRRFYPVPELPVESLRNAGFRFAPGGGENLHGPVAESPEGRESLELIFRGLVYRQRLGKASGLRPDSEHVALDPDGGSLVWLSRWRNRGMPFEWGPGVPLRVFRFYAA